ncbi:Protease synthase and sporulation protein PAI 2 [Roseovarius sp. THAF27]|uniref:FMN-binding negative transcriptional regulator n=1 Tax=Roseovarius sp. THAF27 TaxID=2587850 RepID=UPI0012693C6A|nr:FMN-binding negative transcriptional regulator [Roseovarius sp. THAF27]QFT79160.1 Protease synthase and sporulation protein PAI 2 [Roseovarius sp. THAF27]
MHPNPIFRQTPEARNIAFARAQAFGMLAVGTEDAPLVSHIPFLLSEDGAVAEFHLVRSNPIARALSAPLHARLAVVGPYSYVSPDWYGVEDQVPTWNYVAVHLVGEVELRPEAELRDLLDRQSAHFEDQLLPKAPWTSDKMTPDVMARMMRQIVPCRMRVDEIHGTWKLNQNKDDDVRLRAADAVEASGMGVEVGALAALMRDATG